MQIASKLIKMYTGCGIDPRTTDLVLVSLRYELGYLIKVCKAQLQAAWTKKPNCSGDMILWQHYFVSIANEIKDETTHIICKLGLISLKQGRIHSVLFSKSPL